MSAAKFKSATKTMVSVTKSGANFMAKGAVVIGKAGQKAVTSLGQEIKHSIEKTADVATVVATAAVPKEKKSEYPPLPPLPNKPHGMTRNLTSDFEELREAARAKRGSLFAKQLSVPSSSHTYQTLLDKDKDVEEGKMAPVPQWVALADQAKVDIARIKETINALAKAVRNASLPKFSEAEEIEEEVLINRMTTECTETFRACEAKVKRLPLTGELQGREVDIRKNSQRALAAELQELSIQFKKLNKVYLDEMRKKKMRRDDIDQIFDNADESMPDLDDLDKGFTREQMEELESYETVANERDEAINKIVDSVNALAQLFKDLAVLVIEQGTILDRIDYNLEQTKTSLESANQELNQAEKYQKGGRATSCILALMLIVFFLVMFNILKHT
eukprot:GILK01002397.1.p1 GENE.GILK01002397.1~~GILK01002397.1.p1  ORF type:complete len:410 (-),score=79.59 GILK01002397.1:267-1436(-)